MRASTVPGLVIMFAAFAAVRAEPPSIHPSDIDRSAEPCNDFYQFANGTWRANNPIPASMSRWSRRWKAGEDAKTQLKDILDPIARRMDWPKGSPEQLIGDFYGSCMDEPAVDRAGLTPAAPMLAEIAAIKTRADVQRIVRRLQDIGISAPFGVSSRSDYHNPAATIATVSAGGLGLPHRDYYLKTEPRFSEAREKYVEHVARMLTLAGADDAQREAQQVLRFETSLARASLDNVALRDPKATDHRMSFTSLRQLAPAFDWERYFTEAGIAPADLNVNEPKFLEEANRQFREATLADWRSYLRWQFLHASAEGLSMPFVQENFAFYGAYLAGARELKPRWKRCAEMTDQQLGDALGRKYVETYFPPEAKQRAQQLVGNLIAAMHDTIEGLTWM